VPHLLEPHAEEPGHGAVTPGKTVTSGELPRRQPASRSTSRASAAMS
jgi:hypothetical protein